MAASLDFKANTLRLLRHTGPLHGSVKDGGIHIQACRSAVLGRFCLSPAPGCPGVRTPAEVGEPFAGPHRDLFVFCLHRCPLSKVSASSRYLLPPLPPGPPAAAAASPGLPAGTPRAVAAGPQRPHGPGPPAQRRAAPVADPAAHPAVPGRHRSLLPTSGPAPAIPAAAAAPGSSAPQARLASQVDRGGAEERGWGRGGVKGRDWDWASISQAWMQSQVDGFCLS